MKGIRAQQQLEDEKPERADDIVLIAQLEACELGYDWERNVLEFASRRVFNETRPLLAHQRRSVEEIITRRRVHG